MEAKIKEVRDGEIFVGTSVELATIHEVEDDFAERESRLSYVETSAERPCETTTIEKVYVVAKQIPMVERGGATVDATVMRNYNIVIQDHCQSNNGHSMLGNGGTRRISEIKTDSCDQKSAESRKFDGISGGNFGDIFRYERYPPRRVRNSEDYNQPSSCSSLDNGRTYRTSRIEQDSSEQKCQSRKLEESNGRNLGDVMGARIENGCNTRYLHYNGNNGKSSSMQEKTAFKKSIESEPSLKLENSTEQVLDTHNVNGEKLCGDVMGVRDGSNCNSSPLAYIDENRKWNSVPEKSSLKKSTEPGTAVKLDGTLGKRVRMNERDCNRVFSPKTYDPTHSRIFALAQKYQNKSPDKTETGSVIKSNFEKCVTEKIEGNVTSTNVDASQNGFFVLAQKYPNQSEDKTETASVIIRKCNNFEKCLMEKTEQNVTSEKLNTFQNGITDKSVVKNPLDSTIPARKQVTSSIFDKKDDHHAAKIVETKSTGDNGGIETSPTLASDCATPIVVRKNDHHAAKIIGNTMQAKIVETKSTGYNGGTETSPTLASDCAIPIVVKKDDHRAAKIIGNTMQAKIVETKSTGYNGGTETSPTLASDCAIPIVVKKDDHHAAKIIGNTMQAKIVETKSTGYNGGIETSPTLASDCATPIVVRKDDHHAAKIIGNTMQASASILDRKDDHHAEKIVETKITSNNSRTEKLVAKSQENHILNACRSDVQRTTDNSKKTRTSKETQKGSRRRRSLPNLELVCKLQGAGNVMWRTKPRSRSVGTTESLDSTVLKNLEKSTCKVSRGRSYSAVEKRPVTARNTNAQIPSCNPTSQFGVCTFPKNPSNDSAPFSFNIKKPVNPVTEILERYKTGLTVCNDDLDAKGKLRITSRNKDSPPRNRPIVVVSPRSGGFPPEIKVRSEQRSPEGIKARIEQRSPEWIKARIERRSPEGIKARIEQRSPEGIKVRTEQRSPGMRSNTNSRKQILTRSVSLDDLRRKRAQNDNSFKTTSEKLRELSTSLESLVTKVCDISQNALQRHENLGSESAKFVEITRACATASLKNRPWKSMENLHCNASKDPVNTSPVFCRHLKRGGVNQNIEQKKGNGLTNLKRNDENEQLMRDDDKDQDIGQKNENILLTRFSTDLESRFLRKYFSAVISELEQLEPSVLSNSTQEERGVTNQAKRHDIKRKDTTKIGKQISEFITKDSAVITCENPVGERGLVISHTQRQDVTRKDTRGENQIAESVTRKDLGVRTCANPGLVRTRDKTGGFVTHLHRGQGIGREDVQHRKQILEPVCGVLTCEKPVEGGELLKNQPQRHDDPKRDDTQTETQMSELFSNHEVVLTRKKSRRIFNFDFVTSERHSKPKDNGSKIFNFDVVTSEIHSKPKDNGSGKEVNVERRHLTGSPETRSAHAMVSPSKAYQKERFGILVNGNDENVNNINCNEARNPNRKDKAKMIPWNCSRVRKNGTSDPPEGFESRVIPQEMSAEVSHQGSDYVSRLEIREVKSQPLQDGRSTRLGNVLHLIHNEFAFDGYLNDGIEDVEMAEFIISQASNTEDDLKKAVRKEYKDLYWKDKLVTAMYNIVQTGEVAPTLFTPFPTSDDSSYSVPRSSSDCSMSAITTQDKRLDDHPENISLRLDEMSDVKNALTTIFNDYHRNIGVFLATTVNVLVEKLPIKIKEVQQQINLERRLRRRVWKSYLKLTNNTTDLGMKETKDMDGKLRRDITEMEWKIAYLRNVKRKLKNIYAERFGLDSCLLKSFMEQFSKAHTAMHPYIENAHLSFSPVWCQHRDMHGPNDAYECKHGADLQHGTQTGLLAYLFARGAMNQGYVRHFFCAYRYCTTSAHLLDFIREKYVAAVSFDDVNKQSFHQIQIQYRALDIITEWLDDYYGVDFKDNEGLRRNLRSFLEQEIIPTDKSDRGKALLHTLMEKEGVGKYVSSYQPRFLLNSYLEDLGNIGLAEPRTSTDQNSNKVRDVRNSLPHIFFGCEAFILDYSDQVLAEQLSLIQQDMFHRVHPVHFLNTRSLGIGIARKPTANSIASHKDIVLGFSAGLRRGSVGSSNELISEMSGPATLAEEVNNDVIEEVIEHAQNLSMWIAGEICGMPSIKTQLTLITKFVNVAQCCQELRNFETSIQIVDALETFVVRQLPVWKQVPTKSLEMLDKLKAVKVLLKTDASWLIQGDAYRRKPTIPSVLLFIMHVQQEEIGGLLLANGMYKWAKLRSIARLLDQIRAFQELKYGFAPDEDLQSSIKRCITNLKDQNLHLIASENSVNFHGPRPSTSSKKFKNALEKVKSSFI